MASHPGLAIIQTMVTQTGPGSAALAASWAETYGLTNVHVWADTTNYMYWNFTSLAPIGGFYPSVIIIDADTMTIDYLAQSGVSGGSVAIQAILDAEHLCADY